MSGSRAVRIVLLVMGALVALVASLGLRVERRQVTNDLMLVVDITGSMNARDYSRDGVPVSRLDMIRRTLPETLAHLTCGSKVGLSIFTERRSFVLLMPVEVCGNYAVLTAAIEALNWRAAWEGDSRVASGLHYALTTSAAAGGYDVVFLSDGQEAPPLPWNGGPKFEGKVGAVGGLVVGVGGTQPVPIPKFDEDGRETGFYGMDEIPQESRIGAPPLGAENRPGFHIRNNPYGEMPVGTEHLTEVREAYLTALAADLGLAYARYGDPRELARAIQAAARPHPLNSPSEISALPGALALLAVIAAYLCGLRRSYRPVTRTKPDQRMQLSLTSKLVSMAALLATLMSAPSAQAHGPTPQKVAEAIDISAPCELIWSTLLDFGSIGKWHPGVKSVTATGARERGAERTLVLLNDQSIVERLDEVNGSEQSLSYRLAKENLQALPVSFYTARMAVSRPDDPLTCHVVWEGRLYRGDTTNEPPPELSDEAAVKAMTDFFQTGLAGLKRTME